MKATKMRAHPTSLAILAALLLGTGTANAQSGDDEAPDAQAQSGDDDDEAADDEAADDDDDDGGEAGEAGEGEQAQPTKPTTTGRTLADDPGWISGEAHAPNRDAVPGVRPEPLFELGDPFLGQGKINEGIKMPGGAIWNPSILVYGTLRSTAYAFQDGIDDGALQASLAARGSSRSHQRREAKSPFIDWANRIDIFANLRLTATERVLIGWRPLDDPDEAGATGYYFQPNNRHGPFDGQSGWKQSWDGEIQTLFFEGDVGEIIPDFDTADDSMLDFGFSVGRQRIAFQDGVMVDGRMDAAAITRNSLRSIPFTNNIRITSLYALEDAINGNQRTRRDYVGFFTETDLSWTTMALDLMYASSRTGSGSGIFLGISFTQRIGHLNSTFRYNLSTVLGNNDGRVEDGSIFNMELSLDLPGGAFGTLIPDLIYLNAFVGVDRYRSAFRGRDAPSPLGRVGFLYAGRAIGRYGSPLGSQFKGTAGGQPLIFADRSVGFALGYQMFLTADARHQLSFELGARTSTANKVHNGAAALGVRYQFALGKHVVILGEGFAGMQDGVDPDISLWGARTELLVKF